MIFNKILPSAERAVLNSSTDVQGMMYGRR